MTAVDVAIIGGGIIGTSAAAYLAEEGRSVTLYERSDIAAGASGRNSGVVQHPFDPVFAALHLRSLELYRDPRLTEAGFRLPANPSGLMLVSFDEEQVSRAAADLTRTWPNLSPELLPAGAAVREEPALNPDVAACRIDTAYPVAPKAATEAFAERARRAGAQIATSSEARVVTDQSRVTGVALANGETIGANQVLVAAGPWSPSIVPGWQHAPPIGSIWGVVVSTILAQPPRAVLEELGIDRSDTHADWLFSLVTAGDRSSVGSTFLRDQPDADALAPGILARGQAYVPQLSTAAVEGVRACARPVSFDGHPLIGPIPGLDGLFVCAGHGPWGISTGPASAELVARQMLGQAGDLDEVSPRRFQPEPLANTELERKRQARRKSLENTS